MSTLEVKNARDTISILLDFYEGRPASTESVLLGINTGDIPDDEKTKSLREFLKKEAEKRQLMAQLTPDERRIMEEAGKSSQARRRK